MSFSIDGRLLEWAKYVTSQYSNIAIENFSTSWRDGLAFCAVVHHYYPEEIDYTSLNENHKIGNLNLAFGSLEKLGIKAILNPEEVAESPDQRAIRNYLILVHNKLTGKIIQMTSKRPRPSPKPFSIPVPLTPAENLIGPFSPRMSLPVLPKSIDFTYKVILLGDGGVGKSALFERWKTTEFRPTSTTIGMDVHPRNYSCDGKVIQIQVWDTAGQEVHRAITKTYFRDVKGAIVVFDITRAESFRNISMWTKELFATIPPDVKIPVLLVGNKNDLTDKRVISVEEARGFAQDFSFQYIETSAKNGNDCQKSFQLLFQHIYRVQNNIPSQTTNGIHLESTNGYHNPNDSLPDPPVQSTCICSN